MQIQTTWKGFSSFECSLEPFERDTKKSNVNSKGILTIGMQIQTIRMKFAKESIANLNHSNGQLNANLNHSNEIQRNRMQIRIIRKGF